MANKIKFGLKNVYYAVITETDGTVTYDTPVHIPGAVNLTLDAAGDPIQFYADDGVYYEENPNDGYTGSLEMALIPDEFRVDVLGDEIDTNGALIETRGAKPKKFALMFEFDGDSKKTRYVLYNVLPSRPSIASTTLTNTKEPQTESINITARPAVDTGDVKAKVKQGDAAYDTFYSAVYMKDSPTNTVASDSETFSKASPEDISIDATSTDATNKVKNVLLDGTPIGGIYLTATGVDVNIDKAVFSALANGTYTVTVEFVKGNAVTVTVTVGA